MHTQTSTAPTTSMQVDGIADGVDVGDAGPQATPQETRLELLKVSGRGYTVVRHLFTQLPSDESARASVLGPMVTDRKRRSIQLYLMLLTAWPYVANLAEKGQPPLASEVWARALRTQKGRQWTNTHVSAAWTDLEQRGLIDRKRLARGVVVRPRREDGNADYTKPGQKANDRRETYFVLPQEFWTEEWFERLTLPGLAMLLVISAGTSDKAEIWLTNAKVQDWYGISPRSAEAGIEDLKAHGLLTERVEWIKAPLSAIGATQRHWYSLAGAFGTDQRRKVQKAAQVQLETRRGKSASGDVADPEVRRVLVKKTGKKQKKRPSGEVAGK
ncbi:hypothetical protein [Nocardia vulneris]|nr:hypothetical protein [Nocardia vulneris]